MADEGTCVEAIICNSACSIQNLDGCVCEVAACNITLPSSQDFCPGNYCGFYQGACQACPIGYRERHGECVQCTDGPGTYTIFYLIFLVAGVLSFNLYCVRYRTRKGPIAVIVVLFETLLCCLFTLLSLVPYGSLSLHMCEVESVSDFYTALDNPPGFDCTHEAAYPLWSGPLVYLLIASLVTAVVRTSAALKFKDPHLAKSSLYSLLGYAPVAIGHVILSGVIYYSFGYVVLATTLGLLYVLLTSEGTHPLQTNHHWLVAPALLYFVQVFGVAAITLFFTHEPTYLSACILVSLITPLLLISQRMFMS